MKCFCVVLSFQMQDVGFLPLEGTKFTVLPSGKLVVLGQSTRKTPPQTIVACCSLPAATKGTPLGECTRIPGPCQHGNSVNLVNVELGNQEQLVLGCTECKVIRLMDLQTGTTRQVFQNHNFRPGAMCLGTKGQIFVVNDVFGAKQILQLDCSADPFQVTQTIQSGVGRCHSVCYISKRRLLVLTKWSDSLIRAVSCDSSKLVWTTDKSVDSQRIKPHDAAYCPRQDLLYVADGGNSRILVLNPADGSKIQVVYLNEEVGFVDQLGLVGDELVLHHQECDEEKISFFSFH